MVTLEGMIYLQSTKHMALKLFGNIYNSQILTVKTNVINKLYTNYHYTLSIHMMDYGQHFRFKKFEIMIV